MAIDSPVFVTGYPRCRTAWLSTVLTACGVQCSHGGMQDFATFEEWADDLDARRKGGMAGDSDPALVFHVERILERWPDSRWVIINDDPDASLSRFIKAAGKHGEKLASGWQGFNDAFDSALATLRKLTVVGRLIYYNREDLESAATIRNICTFAAFKTPDDLQIARLQRLRVTTIFPDDDTPDQRQPERVNVLHKLNLINSEGLQSEVFDMQHFSEVSRWWLAHCGSELQRDAIPPTGILVRLHGEPVAAVWCYESYGVPVAELTFPVTRPGLSLGDASRALLYGVLACMHVAGKAHVPEASFRMFRVIAPRTMARFLERIGFERYADNRTPMKMFL